MDAVEDIESNCPVYNPNKLIGGSHSRFGNLDLQAIQMDFSLLVGYNPGINCHSGCSEVLYSGKSSSLFKIAADRNSVVNPFYSLVKLLYHIPTFHFFRHREVIMRNFFYHIIYLHYFSGVFGCDLIFYISSPHF